MKRVWVRHRLDVSVGDLLTGGVACVGAWERGWYERRVLARCGLEGGGMVCLSVRTGWDLCLRALGVGEGDEVMVSAVTHPEMARVVRGCGAAVVPVDLDVRTLAPREEDLRAALTPRTRVLVVAHLFGGSVDLGPAARFAADHGLVLVEDCAQAFVGPDEIGCSVAGVSLYSFGTLKTATALGGAVVAVKDERLLERMRRAEADYPTQGRHEYARRLLKVLALLCAQDPLAYGLLLRILARMGAEADAAIGQVTRAFPADGTTRDLLRRLRRRPSVPLLAALARRLDRFDAAAIGVRTAAGGRLSGALDPSILQPGCDACGRTYYLFPGVVANPHEIVQDLLRRGFDAARATSSIAPLRPDGDVAAPPEATRMMAGIVFLPAYPALPERERLRLAAAVNESAVPTGRPTEAPA